MPGDFDGVHAQATRFCTQTGRNSGVPWLTLTDSSTVSGWMTSSSGFCTHISIVRGGCWLLITPRLGYAKTWTWPSEYKATRLWPGDQASVCTGLVRPQLTFLFSVLNPLWRRLFVMQPGTAMSGYEFYSLSHSRSTLLGVMMDHYLPNTTASALYTSGPLVLVKFVALQARALLELFQNKGSQARLQDSRKIGGLYFWFYPFTAP